MIGRWVRDGGSVFLAGLVRGPVTGKALMPPSFDLLVTVGDALTTAGVDWWMTDGTLLGWYRDGDFIPGDSDIDIGFYGKTWGEAHLALADAGVTLGRLYGSRPFWMAGVVHPRAPGDSCDLFAFYHRGPRTVYHVCYSHPTKRQTMRRHEYRYQTITTTWAEWRGHRFRVPADVEGFLTTKYGNWRVPVLGLDWSHLSGPLNHRPTRYEAPFLDNLDLRTLTNLP